MTHEEKKAMVKRLKTTWTAFGGLTKEEQEFLRLYSPEGFVGSVGWMGCFISGHEAFSDGVVYRLSPNFVLPEPAKPVMKQVELEVVYGRNVGKMNGKAMQVNLDGWKTVSEAWLYAINRGMGPEFKFEGSDIWWLVPSDASTNKPAKLVKMRVWVKEDK